MKNTLIFIRHAKTKVDKSIPIEKWILTEDGLDMSQGLAVDERFTKIDVLISSNEEKAFLTLEPLADKLKKKVVRILELGEIKRPSSEKLSIEEYEHMKYKIFTNLNYTKYKWETANHALKRFKKAVEKIDKQYEGKTILICAHGTVLTLYFASLQNKMDKLLSRWQMLKFGSVGVVKNNKVTRDIVKEKFWNLFRTFCIEIIAGVGALGAGYGYFILPNISKATGANTLILQAYLQTILTFASIFIPLILLVFFELTRQSLWKNIDKNKIYSKVFIAVIVSSTLFIFIALSQGAINTAPSLQSAISYAYTGVGIALMALIALLLIYVELY